MLDIVHQVPCSVQAPSCPFLPITTLKLMTGLIKPKSGLRDSNAKTSRYPQATQISKLLQIQLLSLHHTILWRKDLMLFDH